MTKNTLIQKREIDNKIKNKKNFSLVKNRRLLITYLIKIKNMGIENIFITCGCIKEFKTYGLNIAANPKRYCTNKLNLYTLANQK